ncbi:hypothetical protein TREES_T100013192 [Tupaia chinensis]|uniref:Uncharacterized protein n=1 Tax=Tupaia chinensis TaxID=246437 RepID=L9KN95_TUPCH|nr:hypothetical protein TREES_T100013192 [Tupaia chinensis]
MSVLGAPCKYQAMGWTPESPSQRLSSLPLTHVFKPLKDKALSSLTRAGKAHRVGGLCGVGFGCVVSVHHPAFCPAAGFLTLGQPSTGEAGKAPRAVAWTGLSPLSLRAKPWFSASGYDGTVPATETWPLENEVEIKPVKGEYACHLESNSGDDKQGGLCRSPEWRSPGGVLGTEKARAQRAGKLPYRIHPSALPWLTAEFPSSRHAPGPGGAGLNRQKAVTTPACVSSQPDGMAGTHPADTVPVNSPWPRESPSQPQLEASAAARAEGGQLRASSCEL